MTSITQAAKAHNITRQRMLALVHQGRVPGARMVDCRWQLPDTFTISPPPHRRRAPDKITTT